MCDWCGLCGFGVGFQVGWGLGGGFRWVEFGLFGFGVGCGVGFGFCGLGGFLGLGCMSLCLMEICG